MERSNDKVMPPSVTAPGYPPNRLFFTLDGSLYLEYKRAEGDTFLPTTQHWRTFALSLDTDRDLNDDETLFFDTDKRQFVFIRKTNDQVQTGANDQIYLQSSN